MSVNNSQETWQKCHLEKWRDIQCWFIRQNNNNGLSTQSHPIRLSTSLFAELRLKWKHVDGNVCKYNEGWVNISTCYISVVWKIGKKHWKKYDAIRNEKTRTKNTIILWLSTEWTVFFWYFVDGQFSWFSLHSDHLASPLHSHSWDFFCVTFHFVYSMGS